MGFNIKYIWRSKLPRSFLQIFREVRREIIYIFPSFHFNGKSLSIAAPASYSFRQPKSFGTRILWGAADLPSWIENHQVQKVSFLPTYPIISNSKKASLVKYLLSAVGGKPPIPPSFFEPMVFLIGWGWGYPPMPLRKKIAKNCYFGQEKPC